MQLSDSSQVKVASLKKRSNFLAMRKYGGVVFTSAFTLQYARTDKILSANNSVADVNVGLTASKKVGNSPQRNRAKRRIREAFRLHFMSNCPKDYCYVVIANSKILRMDFAEIVTNMNFALRKMHKNIEQEQVVIT